MDREAAIETLREACVGLDLTHEERATVTWLERWWDVQTIANVAAVIDKARWSGGSRE